MLRTLLLYLNLLSWCTFSCSKHCTLPNDCIITTDYYWKDYNGVVPHDAIKGGEDAAGKTTYIGQVLSPNTKGILPAIIYPDKSEAVSTAGLARFTHSLYIKILCSHEKSNFEWRKLDVKDMHLQTDVHLVQGGIESDLPLYVGRAFFEGELMVGKVFDNSYWARGLRLPMKNGSEYGFLTYEVLVYPRECLHLWVTHAKK